MRTTKESIFTMGREFGDELHAARSHQDRDLTPEGLDKHRQMLADRTRARYRSRIAEQREAVALAESADARSFDKYRPRIDWNSPASVAKAQAKWESVKTRLDAGIGVSNIVANADADTLAALREYYPAHAEAQAELTGSRTRIPGEPHSQPDLTGFHRGLDERAAEIGGAGAASTHATWRASVALAAWAGPTLDQYDAAAEGREDHPNSALAAINAHYAASHERASAATLAAAEESEPVS